MKTTTTFDETDIRRSSLNKPPETLQEFDFNSDAHEYMRTSDIVQFLLPDGRIRILKNRFGPIDE